MAAGLHLCPSCACHLRVPDELDLMRCNNCDAELAFIESGGVRGLALLPTIDTAVPYSVPQQHTRKAFDGGELLQLRRSLLHARASRRHALWSGVFLFTVASMFAAFGAGYLGGHKLLQEEGQTGETAALALLGAIMAMPILAYLALYFQGQARLALEEARKWR